MKKLLLGLSLAAVWAAGADTVDVAALTEDGMFPFVISYTAPDNAVNMSHLLEKPAGKSGRIRVENGHFVNDKGRVRLHATNLTGPANFPTHEEAERLAARLARFGINCVRLHYFDSDYGTFMLPPQQGIIADDFRTRLRFDPKQRDRQDYLIAQFKKQGIYVDMNLHVARTLDARDGFAPGTSWANKGADAWEPRIIEQEKAYARELLSHVNPYTGMRYLEDPVVAVVELNNEDALFNQYLGGAMDRLGEPYATEFRNLWNGWILKKYGSGKAALEAWRVEKNVPGGEMVTEGSFEAGPERVIDGRTWALEKGGSSASVTRSGGVLRVGVTSNGDVYFPKLYRRVKVRKGVPYTVTFRVRRVSKTGGEIGFAIADRSKGWESLGVLTRLPTDRTWRTHTFSFFAPRDVDAAEIQFTRFPAGDYEIDDISFRSGANFPSLVGKTPEKGEIPIVKSADVAQPRLQRDFFQFLVDTEHAYWTGMRDYLRGLGLKAPVSATQLGYSPAHLQAEMDFVDNHAYWCHPSIGKNWQIQNRAMVNTDGGCILGLAGERVMNKPYTVSEYNHPYPIFYGAEGQPMLRAYGALQGWDGVFEYSYNNREKAEPDFNEYFFSMAARTDVLAHFPACAAIYLRGDVRESSKKTVVGLPYDRMFERLVTTRAVSQGIASSSDGAVSSRLGLVHAVAVDVTGKQGPLVDRPKNPGKIAVSETRELTWNNEIPGAGFMTVDTANTKLFTGFPKGRLFRLGSVSFAIGTTKLGWATVSLVSRHATGFGSDGKAAQLLLTATALSHNRGAKFTPQGGGAISCRDADWGTGPVMNEGVPLVVTLPSPVSATACWALDEAGNRKASVPVKASADGTASVAVGPEYRTVWYEIAISEK